MKHIVNRAITFVFDLECNILLPSTNGRVEEVLYLSECVCLFVFLRSNCRNIGPIWTKFGVYLNDIDPRLPIEKGRYSSTDVTMATESPFKLGLINSNCHTIGPIWMKFGVYLTDIDPRLLSENERYSSTDVTMATEKLLKLGLIHSKCRSIGPI